MSKVIISTVDLRHTSGRSAQYIVDLNQYDDGTFSTTIHYGKIGRGLTVKESAKTDSFSTARDLYIKNVSKELKGGYKRYSGDVIPIDRAIPGNRTVSNPVKTPAATCTRAVILSQAFKAFDSPAPASEIDSWIDGEVVTEEI